MQKLIKKLITTTFVIIAVLVGAYSVQQSKATEVNHEIQYVQCVVVDNEVKSCMDLKENKIIDTAMVEKVYNK